MDQTAAQPGGPHAGANPAGAWGGPPDQPGVDQLVEGLAGGQCGAAGPAHGRDDGR